MVFDIQDDGRAKISITGLYAASPPRAINDLAELIQRLTSQLTA